MRMLPVIALLAGASAAPAARPGPQVGDTLPAFSAPDQQGRLRDLASLGGPEGLVLVFFRSADW